MRTISLSKVCRKDADDLVKANIESRSYHAPWVQPFITREGFDTWFDEQVSGANIGFIARELDTGGIVGITHLSQIFMRGFQNAYLGYYGMKGFAGRGLMTEAVRLTVQTAFNDIGLHRLEANIQPGNMKSIALIHRLGFRHEGFSPRYLRINGAWRDHERWALLRDES
ncbi:N-acetyltransferase [Komagataeibacter medellinensis]|uniref:GCN5-related N-acetyltransferase n=2 Tax=Komagataeibacter medellinensis TaxID=1177712 RepID=G2I421_KOMMN|nr:GNAT family protein [Komagataeibacter medellinensis]KAB8122503.1 N-acetyltransferase [Komagataeibacter medellinensis]BAK82868.1 GCN5-related N-acetyltransferase [Komagataeibacter medellinensis NBRC 3288]